MARPIALLTDFGYSDAYVGVMKGVVLSRCREAVLFDLTHAVPAHDIQVGALHLASAVPYCPPDTVFLAVVDPGVGSERRPICIRSGGRLFVGPDNGLLWPGAVRAAAPGSEEPEAFHLNSPRHWLPQPGATFHGRDIFAPVAAMLALGRAADDFGVPIQDPMRLEFPTPLVLSGSVSGQVLLVDGFGNAVTNIRSEDLGNPAPGTVTFRIGDLSLRGPATHYGAVPAGEPLVVLGSFGSFEVAVHGGSAARQLGLPTGAAVNAVLS